MHKSCNDCREINVSINLNVIVNLGGAIDGIVEAVKKLLKR